MTFCRPSTPARYNLGLNLKRYFNVRKVDAYFFKTGDDHTYFLPVDENMSILLFSQATQITCLQNRTKRLKMLTRLAHIISWTGTNMLTINLDIVDS